MFSEIMSRRPARTHRSEQTAITESELTELRNTVRSLRRTYDQICNEGRSDDQTCVAATFEIDQLQREVEERRKERDVLLEGLHRADGELATLRGQCAREKEEGELHRGEADRLRNDIEGAKTEMVNLRGEIDQIDYFRDTVDTETMYRLRADCQNLEMEREMDEIKVRHLKTDRDELRAHLNRLTAERSSLTDNPQGKSRELIEAEMECDMQIVRQQALIEHLERDGWKRPKDMTTLTRQENLGDKMRSSVLGLIKGLARHDSSDSNLQSSHTDLKNNDLSEVEKSHFSQQQIAQTPQVGGIEITDDNKDFFRQLPKVFRIGAVNEELENDHYAPRFEYAREIEFDEDDATNVSNISDEEDWGANEEDEQTE